MFYDMETIKVTLWKTTLTTFSLTECTSCQQQGCNCRGSKTVLWTSSNF